MELFWLDKGITWVSDELMTKTKLFAKEMYRSERLEVVVRKSVKRMTRCCVGPRKLFK
jgi:hypothetical protein